MNARCGLANLQIELGDQAMVHFEHHYGDHLETPETAQRSEWYNVTSHPHVRFDGQNPVIGALNCSVATENYRDRINQRLDETGGVSPVEITGQYEKTPESISITATYRLVDPSWFFDLQASLLIYEDNIYWCCGAGGEDTWNRVTRRIHDERIVLTNVGDQVTVSATIPMDPSWNPDELHFVAYLQETESQEIIQGFVVTQSAASAGEMANLDAASTLAAAPNPFHSAARISFEVSAADAAGPVLLQVFDLRGRRVADLFSGRMAPGPHSVDWDARASVGRGPSDGLYLARLTTRAGARAAKLIRLD